MCLASLDIYPKILFALAVVESSMYPWNWVFFCLDNLTYFVKRQPDHVYNAKPKFSRLFVVFSWKDKFGPIELPCIEHKGCVYMHVVAYSSQRSKHDLIHWFHLRTRCGPATNDSSGWRWRFSTTPLPSKPNQPIFPSVSTRWQRLASSARRFAQIVFSPRSSNFSNFCAGRSERDQPSRFDFATATPQFLESVWIHVGCLAAIFAGVPCRPSLKQINVLCQEPSASVKLQVFWVLQTFFHSRAQGPYIVLNNLDFGASSKIMTAYAASNQGICSVKWDWWPVVAMYFRRLKCKK